MNPEIGTRTEAHLRVLRGLRVLVEGMKLTAFTNGGEDFGAMPAATKGGVDIAAARTQRQTGERLREHHRAVCAHGLNSARRRGERCANPDRNPGRRLDIPARVPA